MDADLSCCQRPNEAFIRHRLGRLPFALVPIVLFLNGTKWHRLAESDGEGVWALAGDDHSAPLLKGGFEE
jgi:hypothetical protein